MPSEQEQQAEERLHRELSEWFAHMGITRPPRYSVTIRNVGWRHAAYQAETAFVVRGVSFKAAATTLNGLQVSATMPCSWGAKPHFRVIRGPDDLDILSREARHRRAR